MIKVSNLSKSFSQTIVLDGINLSIEKGIWVTIVGPSGSGKSTLLNCISGLLSPNSGGVHYGETNLYSLTEKKRSDYRRKNIGFVFQDFKLLPHYSVLDNVMLPLMYEKPRKQLIPLAKNYLIQVGIDETLFSRLPDGLSGGEKQRVAIARSLIADPNVLICDEPSGNLDEENRDNIVKLFSHLRDEGKTIILVTHDMEVATYGDNTYRLKNGRLQPSEVTV